METTRQPQCGEEVVALTVIFWTEEKWFEIYMNGKYTGDVLAINRLHAFIKAHLKKVVAGKTNHCYMVYVKEKEM